MGAKSSFLKALEARRRSLEARLASVEDQLEKVKGLIREAERRDEQPGREEALSGAQMMAAWRWGKIPRSALDRKARAEIMRQLAKQNPVKSTGRPRTVEHRPGPRGGCRCADCRAR
jgi:hypothetical protein